MKTNQPATQPLNVVQTTFSQNAVQHLECVAHWFWEYFDGDPTTDGLMHMLAVYAEANPQKLHQTPADMVRLISKVVQLYEQLTVINEVDEVYNWVDTMDGWRKPVAGQ